MKRLGAALLLAILVGGGATAVRFAPQPPTPAPLPTAGPSRAVTVEGDSMRLELDNATLTAQLNGLLAGRSLGETPLGPASAGELAVQVREGQVVAEGSARAGLASLPVSLTFGVEAREGRLVVSLREGRLGGVPLPETALGPIQEVVQGPVDRLFAQQRLKVETAATRPGSLVLVATKR